MRAPAAASSLCFAIALLLLGCSSDATKAREALALGKTRAAAGTLEQAGTSFAEAARLDPRLHEAFARLARVRLTQGRARDAETAALRAASLAPRSSFYSELLARAQLATGKKDGALASFEQAIALDATQTARLAFSIGALREQMGKPDDALAAYERAATADASAVLPRLALVRLQLRADRLDLAEKRLAEVRAHVPAEGSERVLFAALEARVTTLTRERQIARERETQREIEHTLQVMGAFGVGMNTSREWMRDANVGILQIFGGMDGASRAFADVLGSSRGSAADVLESANGVGIATSAPPRALGGYGGGGGISMGTLHVVIAPIAASPPASERVVPPAAAAPTATP